MNAIEIAVIVIVGALFALAVGYLVYRKIKHKGGCCECSGSCSSCTGCGQTMRTPSEKSGDCAKSCPHCK